MCRCWGLGLSRSRAPVLGEVALAIIRQLPAQELWCAGEIVVQLDGDAAWRMTVPSSIDEADVADSPVIPG